MKENQKIPRTEFGARETSDTSEIHFLDGPHAGVQAFTPDALGDPAGHLSSSRQDVAL